MQGSQSETQPCKISILKERLNGLLDKTTIHGIPRIKFASHWYLKLMWTISLVVLAGFCIFFVHKSIISYLKFDTVTIIDVFYEKTSEFPSVSFCDPNQSLNNVTFLKLKFNYNYLNNSYLTPFQEPFYNNCYSFNQVLNNSVYFSTNSGPNYGLQMDLKVNSVSDYNELIIFIHNRSLNTSTINNRGFRIMSGSMYLFEIEKVFNEKLPSPFNSCLNNVSNFDLNKTIVDTITNELKSIYTHRECLRLCRNLMVIERSKCGCMQTILNTASCQNANETIKECFEKYNADFYKENNSETCSQYCPIECYSSFLEVKSLSLNLPETGNIISSTKAFNYSNHFQTYSEVKRSFFSISIYFNELKYTTITEQPKTEIINLVSSIGGYLGLFLGASFLSFMEFFELLFELVYTIFTNRNSYKVSNK